MSYKKESLPGRNDPCWCGSGIKFKKCHWFRESEQRITPQEAIKSITKSQKKYCLHPNAKSGVCTSIINAHTIQRNGSLNKIARDSQVYMIDNNLMSLSKHDGKVSFKLTGIKQATTFTGFCGVHDSETFKEIEDKPFIPSKKTAFLISYRSICKEYYGKTSQFEQIETLLKGDKGLPKELHKPYQEHINLYKSGVELGLEDISSIKREFDSILISNDFETVSYYVIEFNNVPDFMCSGSILLEMDFHGNQLQSLDDFADSTKRLKSCSFNLIATELGGAAIFSWIGESNEAIQFIETLDSLSNEELPHAIVRFAYSFFENIAISPNWWEGIHESNKELLIKRITIGLNPMLNRESNCLQEDGIRFVNWTVKNRHKSIYTE